MFWCQLQPKDNSEYGKQSVGKIAAHVTGREMGLEDVPVAYSTITPLVGTLVAIWLIEQSATGRISVAEVFLAPTDRERGERDRERARERERERGGDRGARNIAKKKKNKHEKKRRKRRRRTGIATRRRRRRRREKTREKRRKRERKSEQE